MGRIRAVFAVAMLVVFVLGLMTLTACNSKASGSKEGNSPTKSDKIKVSFSIGTGHKDSKQLTDSIAKLFLKELHNMSDIELVDMFKDADIVLDTHYMLIKNSDNIAMSSCYIDFRHYSIKSSLTTSNIDNINDDVSYMVDRFKTFIKEYKNM